MHSRNGAFMQAYTPLSLWLFVRAYAAECVSAGICNSVHDDFTMFAESVMPCLRFYFLLICKCGFCVRVALIHHSVDEACFCSASFSWQSVLQGASFPGAKCERMPLCFSEGDAEIDSGARSEQHAGLRVVNSRWLCSQFAVVNSW